MSSAAKTRKNIIGRLFAKRKKTAEINGTSVTAPFEATEPLEAPSFVPLSAAALQACDERNAAEHFAYKWTVLTERLEALNDEEYGMHCEEEELANSQRYIVRQKRTLLQDLRDISQEERAAASAHASKGPQELEEERDAGEPSLKARFELFFDAKRKILDRLEDAQDEEITRMDEAKELKARREDIGRRKASAQELLIRLEHVVMGHDYAQFECKTTNRTEKSAEADESTAGPMPVIAPLASDEISRERKSAPTPPEGPPPERAKLDEELTLSSQLYPIAHEEEVPFNGLDAEQESAVRTAVRVRTSGSARTHGDDGLPLPGTPISMDQLERAVADRNFRRNDCKEVSGSVADICSHFEVHLRTRDRSFHCSQGGCQQTAAYAWNMHLHFQRCHKKVAWNDEIKNACTVRTNSERLDGIRRLIRLRAGACSAKLSFDLLEEVAKNSTLTSNFKAKKSAVNEHVKRLEAIVQSVLAANPDESRLSLDELEARAENCTITRHGGKELTKNLEKDCELLDNKKHLDAIVTSIYARRPPVAS
ncbi:hypothetical protein AAVH_09024 [Aphelenchoides avenae]|nr:hypothetical protein AAVH_09024 [Aphelenchus avenae]